MSRPDVAIPGTEAQLPSDDIVVLRDVTLGDYQRPLEIRGERMMPRLTCLEGVLELAAPSRRHESLRSMIGRLAEYQAALRAST